MNYRHSSLCLTKIIIWKSIKMKRRDATKLKHMKILAFSNEALYKDFMLNELEKKIIALIQGDIPIIERPFLEIAKKIGVTEEEVIKTLSKLNDQGVLRRFGATLKHQKSGFRANAMVAWQVDESRIEEVGPQMASFKEVTHCYRRNPHENWPYNLYTMVHAKDEASCYEIAAKMSRESGETQYHLLFSRKELKKTSMQYFTNLLDD